MEDIEYQAGQIGNTYDAILDYLREHDPKGRRKAQAKPPRTTPIKYRAPTVRNPLNVPFRKKIPVTSEDADHLMTLVGRRQRGIKYNPRYANKEAAELAAEQPA
jgi:hypothetical protein